MWPRSGSFLVFFLAFLLFLALLLTSFSITIYLFARLFTHVRTDGHSGFHSWLAETKDHFVIVRKPKEEEVIVESEVWDTDKGKDTDVRRESSDEDVKVEGRSDDRFRD
jgi:hypothetical protein